MANKSKANRDSGQIPLTDEVLDVLMQLDFEANVVPRTRALDRNVYVAVDQALQALGGVWTRASKALPTGGHVFPVGVSAAALVEAAVLTGTVKDPHAWDFFQTPAPLADELAARFVRRGDTVLDPGAGLGRLTHAARKAGGIVVTVEKDPDRRARLVADGFVPVHPHVHDFLQLEELSVDVVLGNPPFHGQQDIDFVLHGLHFLRPGGRLAMIMGRNVLYGSNAKAKDFRATLAGWKGELEELPDGTFISEGTGVRSVLCVVEAA